MKKLRIVLTLLMVLPLSGCSYLCRGYELLNLFGGPEAVEADTAAKPKAP